MLEKYLNIVYSWSTDSFIDYKKYLRESLTAIFLALGVRSLFITFYKIPSGSMIPTFEIGDVILADRYQFGWKIPFTSHKDTYRVGLQRDLKRGDIVIFQSPPEKEFLNIRVQIKNKDAVPLLLEMNAASREVKRPINRLLDGTANYIFVDRNLHPRHNKYSIPTVEDPYGNTYVYMVLHPNIYREYRKKIESQNSLEILGGQKIRLYTSYGEEEKWHYLSLLEFPITGISIVSEICLQSPLFLFPRLFLTSGSKIFEEELKKESNYEEKNFDRWQEFVLDFFRFSVYPNRWVNMRKDFVKRVVGIEGDTIEIKNSELYINGTNRKLLGPISYEGSDICIFETPLYNEKGDSIRKHKVRKYIYGMPADEMLGFDKELWPYDPTLRSHFVRGMNIGPIVVPSGHFFVMGDNMEASLDSRCWGFVPYRVLKGYPRAKIWPILEKIN